MDETGFESAWRQYCNPLTRFCTFSTGSSQDGEEVSAEAFYRLLTTKRRIGSDKVEAWLFTVARNLCVSRHRAAARDRKLVDRLAAHEVKASGEAWSDPSLWEAVRVLDGRARLVVYLRAIEDRPFADVARLMNSSEGATKMAYYRAMERLRGRLDAKRPEGVEPHIGGVIDVD